MTANAADFGSALVNTFLRATGLVLLAIGVALMLVFAFATAAVIGVMIAGAALAMRFWPKPRSGNPAILEARRTPTGWVVEP